MRGDLGCLNRGEGCPKLFTKCRNCEYYYEREEEMKYLCSGHKKCKSKGCKHKVAHKMDHRSECSYPCGICAGVYGSTCKQIKEKQMKREGYEETVEFKVKDIKKAYDNGCGDVKKVLKDMCPKVFEEEHCCEWMEEAITTLGIIKKESVYRFRQHIAKGGKFGKDVIYFCPRCGKELKK